MNGLLRLAVHQCLSGPAYAASPTHAHTHSHSLTHTHTHTVHHSRNTGLGSGSLDLGCSCSHHSQRERTALELTLSVTVTCIHWRDGVIVMCRILTGRAGSSLSWSTQLVRTVRRLLQGRDHWHNPLHSVVGSIISAVCSRDVIILHACEALDYSHFEREKIRQICHTQFKGIPVDGQRI